MNPFEGKTIRSRLDLATNTRWYSVIDVCAAIMGCDYQKARNYWKWLKAKRKPENETAGVTYQLKFEAADGKMRRTEVMDACGILGLISSWPKGRGEYARHWLAKLEAESECVVDLVSGSIANVQCISGNLLYRITRTVIYDCRLHGDLCEKNAGVAQIGQCVNKNRDGLPKRYVLKKARANTEMKSRMKVVFPFVNIPRLEKALVNADCKSRCA